MRGLFPALLDSPTEFRHPTGSCQDWYLRYELTSVPGVAEVTPVGIKIYSADIHEIERIGIQTR